jgi:CRISPR-associated protein Cas1
LEGQAARAYFAAFRQWLPPDIGFRGRTGQGATDPVNAVLNLLYTNLFRLCWLASINTGLDPYLGVLHVGRDRYAALAADLQEPFRFLCDRLALELFHRNILTAQDFHRPQKGPGFLRLQTPALKRVLTEWEARLEAKVKVGPSALTYRSHIVAQARRFAEVVSGQRSDLNAFRLKW